MSTTLKHRQEGMVSITVTIIFILVISLVVLGFSQVTRRNSREALDRQLSSQAFYAAETGINDAVSKIHELQAAGAELPSQTSCRGNTYMKNDGKVNDDDDIAYTCLTVNPRPTKYAGGGGGGVVALTPVAETLSDITITWARTTAETSAQASDCPTGASRNTGWSPDACPFGLMRFDVMRKDDNTFTSATRALEDTMSAFVYPSASGSGAVAFSGGSANIYGGFASQGVTPTALCNSSTCSITITGINAAEAYVMYKVLYVTSDSVTIEGKAVSGGEPLELNNMQAVVDVTGKSQDVLRRLQVRIPLRGAGGISTVKGDAGGVGYTIRSGESICKQFSIAPPPADFYRHEDLSCN